MFAVLLLIVIVIVLVILISLFSGSKSNTTNNSPSSYSQPTYYEQPDNSNRRFKIGAEVSEDFYETIQEYCQNNSLTVSALIRKAVESYINSNS